MTTRAIVLAAGAGTRMKSPMPKVLHELAGRPMLAWVVDAVRGAGIEHVTAVIGHGADQVEHAMPDLDTCVQEQQHGTGHAVQVALEHLGDVSNDVVLVVYGDTPLITSATLQRLLVAQEGAAASVLTCEAVDPTGYGRILRNSDGDVVAVVEDADLTAEQRPLREINAGMYAFSGRALTHAIGQLGRENAQGELYLTDVVAILAGIGERLVGVEADMLEVSGVNRHDHLAEAAAEARRSINAKWMEAGVWMQDPERVYVDDSVQLSAGVRLYAGVHLEGDTKVDAGATIGPDVFIADSTVGERARVWYSVLRSAEVGPDVEVGPYASLRPGTVLSTGAKAGTFVEMKNTTVGEGSKVPHLSYIGDAAIGEGSNVGAGVITVNYDGDEKHRTEIGNNAFVGSDTMLVAPVTVGDEAYTGAGSVITKNVPDGTLAVERSDQKHIPNYADRRRRRREKGS